MRVASGDDTFFVNMGAEIRKSYIEYIQGLNTEDVQREIETASQQVRHEEPDAMAKATGLERGDGESRS